MFVYCIGCLVLREVTDRHWVPLELKLQMVVSHHVDTAN